MTTMRKMIVDAAMERRGVDDGDHVLGMVEMERELGKVDHRSKEGMNDVDHVPEIVGTRRGLGRIDSMSPSGRRVTGPGEETREDAVVKGVMTDQEGRAITPSTGGTVGREDSQK
jgi:hypothetical protein